MKISACAEGEGEGERERERETTAKWLVSLLYCLGV